MAKRSTRENDRTDDKKNSSKNKPYSRDRSGGSAKQKDLDPATTDGEEEFLTTQLGLRVENNQDSLKAGVRGPSLLEDHILREKITHFDHERIPERVVHARGAAAHGYFQVYDALAKYTRAGFLNDPSRKTPVFVRFSTVVGSRGSTDLARDVRGFSTKFYTGEGNYDLVGNNIPVFFIQDAMKFPDLVHAIKPEAHHEIPQATAAHDTFWDFISLMPESMHMIMWVMSDRAIPRSYRMMEGFGVHTFRLINEKGASFFVKFHWKPLLGVHSVVWDEAQKISGKDPDFHRRDLWEAIEAGNYPEFELGMQIVPEKDEHKFSFDLLDATKIIPEELVPVIRVGKMTLDRNPDNYFAETEQVAFHPGHLVPGIDLSNDPLLQGRLFSYLDIQLNRFSGANFNELPINRPIAPTHNNQRDGFMRRTINAGRVNYEPNSLAGGCPFQAQWADNGFRSHPEVMNGPKVRAKAPKFQDHFSQARLFYASMAPYEKAHMINALRFELGMVETVQIRRRMVGLLYEVDPGMATQVASAIGVEAGPAERPINRSIPADTDGNMVQPVEVPMKLKRSKALSQADQKLGIRGLKIAILAADGFDDSATGMKKGLEKAGAMVKVIGPRMGDISGGKGSLTADFRLQNQHSVLYDAIHVCGGMNAVDAFRNLPEVKEYIMDAWKHCKAISMGPGAEVLLREWNVIPPGERDWPAGVVAGVTGDKAVRNFVDAVEHGRYYEREQPVDLDMNKRTL